MMDMDEPDCGHLQTDGRAARRRPRVAIVVSHPIQHFCPQYVSLAACDAWEICVFFASSIGRDAYVDRNFGTRVQWGGLRLESFPHVFLNEAPIQVTSELDAPGLEGALDAFQPDVVISYGYSQKYQRRARRHARTRGWAVYHIADSELAGTRSFPARVARVAKAWWHLRGIARVLTVGDANEKFYALAGMPASRMTRMGFPIDIGLYDKALAEGHSSREAYGLSDAAVVFGMAGKFIPIKRQEDLIRAVARLDPSLNVHVVLAGSGPEEQALRALAGGLAPGRVTFAGFVSPEMLPAFYAALDVYVHCSSHEPHSLAISEAIYMGRPVILSDACGSYGPNDDVSPGVNGWTYPMGDVEALAALMRSAASDPGSRRAFGARSRAYAIVSQNRAHGAFLQAALAADGLPAGPQP